MTPIVKRALLEPDPFAWVERNGIELTDDEADDLAAAIAADEASHPPCPDWTTEERHAAIERYKRSGHWGGARSFPDPD